MGQQKHTTMTQSTTSENTMTTADVLVIGAGASGLTAAYDLKRKGIKVKVLEANSIMGGRLRKLEGFGDHPIDLGGEWIHRVGPKVLEEIVDDPSVKLNIKTIPYLRTIKLWKNGKWTETNSGMKNDVKFVNYTWFDFFYDYIGKTVQDDISYDCVVNKIDYGSGKGDSSPSVKVSCCDGRSFEADQVIVTVPIKILKEGDISFSPPLPPVKTKAIERATVGPGLKVFIEFSEKFYHDGFVFQTDYELFAYGDRYFYDECYGQKTQKHILAMFAYGEPAMRFVGLENDAILQEVLKDLDAVYEGRASETYEKHHVQNWTRNEQYIRGAYSSYRNGISPMYDLHGHVERKLFFAGEALPWDCYNHAYVHSAAFSGRAAATAASCIRDGKDPPINPTLRYAKACMLLCCCFGNCW